MAENGTEKSTSNSTAPMISVALRVQFSNGVVVKYVQGSTSRRSSQSRTTTYVSVISSMRPHHRPASSSTTSPTRIAPEKAICMPANTAPSDVCAARPATTDSTPAEANTVVPMLENDGNVVRI